MPFATAPDGARIYYETSGRGQPLLLVPGRNSDHNIFNLARPVFSRRYQVITYDQRGTGKSDSPEQPPYTTRMFAADAVAVLDSLAIPRAHAYGVSMGGAICQWLGIDYPHRFASLVLACANAGKSQGVPASAEAREIINTRDGSRSLGLMFRRRIGFNQLRLFASMAGSAQDVMTPQTEANHALASQEHDAWDLLATIRAPVLILNGSEDQVCPIQNAILLAARIPNSTFEIIPGGRHMFFIENQQKVNRLVGKFLARHTLD